MLRIDLFSEISCPWCLVGQHRLNKVLRERFQGITTDIRHHPVLLLPDAPPTGLYIPDLLLKRYGITDPRAAFARPEAEARASGLEVNLSKQAYTYPTQAAHALIQAAAPKGTQHALFKAVIEAYFLEARNIADPAVLTDIALSHGFTASEAAAVVTDPTRIAQVVELSKAAAAAGVKSVPHFAFDNNAIFINGGRSEDELSAAVSSALARLTDHRA